MVDLKFAESPEYQAQVISLMLEDLQFRGIAKEHLSAEHFESKVLQWFYHTLSDSSLPLNSVTLKEELVKAVKAGRIRDKEIAAYVDTYNHIKHPPTRTTTDYIRTSMGEFIRTQNVKTAILSSMDLIRDGKWSEISDIITKATNSGIDINNLGHKYFDDYEARLAARVAGKSTVRIATGIPELDILTYGGIRNGQVGLIVGGTGRGKSIFLEWLSKTGILLNKKVVYFTLELPEAIMSERFDSMFCRIKPHELYNRIDDSQKKLSELATKYSNTLVIKGYPPASITVGGIKTFLAQLDQSGFRADMIVLDYLDLIKPHKVAMEEHIELKHIITALSGLAIELDLPIWTATQLNRSGLVMETPDEAGVAGAIAKLYTVDMAIFMAQTPAEREDCEMRLVINKSRNGPAGKTIRIDTEYDFMTFFRPAPELSEEISKSEEPVKDDQKLEDATVRIL